jgi:hypothetical protein
VDTGHETGAVEAGLPDMSCGTFTATGDHIVDSSTGLTWLRTIISPESTTMGSSDCLAWGGRLPTESELTSLGAAAKACRSQIVWPFPPSGQCAWSSTPFGDSGTSGADYCVYFDGGTPTPTPNADYHWILCVK